MKIHCLRLAPLCSTSQAWKRAAKFYENALGLKRVWTDNEQEMIGFIFPESDSEIVIHKDSSMPNPFVRFMVGDVQKFCDEYQKKGCTRARCNSYTEML
jgi:hypothetical protein